MRPTRFRRAAGAFASLALMLALPATAAAVPTVTTVDAKLGDPGVTFLTDPTGAALTSTQTRAVVSLDGYALGFAEDNGLTRGGVLDYSALPATYRAPMTAGQKVAYPAAQTGVQAHATCSGVATLTTEAAILSWQTVRPDGDPSYAYVPFQRATAGLGDDPATWLPVVRLATGVDLAATADPRAACVRLGGRYEPADTAVPIADKLIADALVPLQAQIAGLQRTEATLRRDLDTLRRAKEASDRATATARAAQAAAREAQRAAEVAYQSLFTRPIELTLAAKRFAPGGGVALVTGSATDPVALTVEVTRRQRRALRLSSTVLVEANGVIGEQGALLVTLKPDRATARQLARALQTRRRGIAVTVFAVSGGNNDSARATLTR